MRKRFNCGKAMVAILLCLLTILWGCSAASVTEKYKGPTIRTESISEGVQEEYIWVADDGAIHVTPVSIRFIRIIEEK